MHIDIDIDIDHIISWYLAIVLCILVNFIVRPKIILRHVLQTFKCFLPCHCSTDFNMLYLQRKSTSLGEFDSRWEALGLWCKISWALLDHSIVSSKLWAAHYPSLHRLAFATITLATRAAGGLCGKGDATNRSSSQVSEKQKVFGSKVGGWCQERIEQQSETTPPLQHIQHTLARNDRWRKEHQQPRHWRIFASNLHTRLQSFALMLANLQDSLRSVWLRKHT